MCPDAEVELYEIAIAVLSTRRRNAQRRTSTGPHALISAALSPCDLTNRRLLPDFSPIESQVSAQALPVSHAHHRFRLPRSVPPSRFAPPANGLLAPLGR